MNAVIEPCLWKGTVNVPSSKSLTQRYLAAALLRKGTTLLHNVGSSADELIALEIIKSLGAEVCENDDAPLRITSDGLHPKTERINCGESGLSARLFGCIASASPTAIIVTGKGSLLNRPMLPLIDALQNAGAVVTHSNGHLPIAVCGLLKREDTSEQVLHMDGSSGSQTISGLLMCLSFLTKHTVELQVSAPTSKPYIDLTVDCIQQFGGLVEQDNYERYRIHPLPYHPEAILEIVIENDWSSGAVWVIAAAIQGGGIAIEGLNIASKQADRTVVNLLQHCGVEIAVDQQQRITISRSENLKAFHFDASDCPDLFPVVAILAACAEGQSSIRGLHRLVHKESNREESIAMMLEALGVTFSILEDYLVIEGKTSFKSCTIPSFHDHRIVMAAALASLNADGPITILKAQAQDKSYPAFLTHLKLLGVPVSLQEEA